MKYVVVCVRDRAADVYGVPQFVPSIGVAIRSFTDMVNREDVNNQVYSHPEDFDLYHVADYDDATASFSCIPPKQLAIGKNVSLSFVAKVPKKGELYAS